MKTSVSAGVEINEYRLMTLGEFTLNNERFKAEQN
jgi:hypothetical protein